MIHMLPFEYVEFYDVPRCLVLRHREKVLLLQSAFVEDIDDYNENYSVYLMDSSVEDMAKAGNWTFLSSIEGSPIGEVRVRDVVFDETRRGSMNADCLSDLV